MAKSKVDWSKGNKISSDFQSEPLKGLYAEYEKAREATSLAFKKAAEANKLEAKEEAFKVALVKQLKQMAPDNEHYAKYGIPPGKTRPIAMKFGIVVGPLEDEGGSSSKGSSKGIKL
jgi:hypothetical protein